MSNHLLMKVPFVGVALRLAPLYRRYRRWFVLVSSLLLVFAVFAVRFFFRFYALRQWQHDMLAVESSPLKHLLDQHQNTLTNYNQYQVDALLVLGYSVNHAAEIPSNPLIQRLETAYQLACHVGVTDTIIVTGGTHPRVPRWWATEADVMAKWLRQRNDNDTNKPATLCNGSDRPLKLILERESTSTRLNAANAMTILNSVHPHIRRMILVTNRFHQWRALRVFQQVARELFPLPPTPTSTPSPMINHHPTATDDTLWSEGSDSIFTFIVAPMTLDSAVPQFDFWRELLAMALYRVMGWV